MSSMNDDLDREMQEIADMRFAMNRRDARKETERRIQRIVVGIVLFIIGAIALIGRLH